MEKIKVTEVHGIEATELLNYFKKIEQSLNTLNQSLSENQHKKILTRQEVAEYFGISLPTLHSWTKKGVIKAHRIGNKIRYRQEDVLNAFKQVRPIEY